VKRLQTSGRGKKKTEGIKDGFRGGTGKTREHGGWEGTREPENGGGGGSRKRPRILGNCAFGRQWVGRLGRNSGDL